MEREIEFRAWHKVNESMYFMGWNKRPNAEVFYTIGTLFALGEDAEFMQFTGMTDKNGVKIFEGDIVEWALIIKSDWVSKPDTIKKTQYEVLFENDNIMGIVGFYFKDKNGKHIHFHNFEDVEIIGNIYQNPELLN